MMDKALLDAIRQIKAVVYSDPNKVRVEFRIHGKNSLTEAESFVSNITDNIHHDHANDLYWCKGELDNIEFVAFYDDAEVRERHELETYHRLKAKYEPLPETDQSTADDEAAKDFELLEAARQSTPIGDVVNA